MVGATSTRNIQTKPTVPHIIHPNGINRYTQSAQTKP